MDDCMFANNQESSSGCESGWTVYFDHSSIDYSYDDYNNCNNNNNNNNNNNVDKNRENEAPFLDKASRPNEEDDEEEDLSMVSDASSGPPHYNNQEIGSYSVFKIEDESCKKTIGRDQKQRRKARDDNVLDDTASSTLFDFSDKSFGLTRNQPSLLDNALEYSQGYSSTQFEVRPQYHDFFQPAELGNQMHQNQWFEGKMW